MLELANQVLAYPWGAVDGLARLVGTRPTGGPEAELWVGAHPAAPSRAPDGRTLAEVVADDPPAVLGDEVAARFGDRLPFLLKVLAIGAPLSIQLHPSQVQAEAGFAREEAAGVPLDAPERTYRDRSAKPEVLVALEPTWVLAGFRTGPDAAAHLRTAGLDDLAAHAEGAGDARGAFVALLSAHDRERRRLAAVAAGADPAASEELAWVSRLAGHHPGDPTALAPLVLDLRRLDTGDAVYLPAGVPHAYLCGAGVELMGASDNVVRGGLTTKHVDAAELVAVLAPPGTGVDHLRPRPAGPGVLRYRAATPEIALLRVEPSEEAVAVPPGPGPALVLPVGGPATVVAGGRRVLVGDGAAALAVASERAHLAVTGPVGAWVATVGDLREGS